MAVLHLKLLGSPEDTRRIQRRRMGRREAVVDLTEDDDGGPAAESRGGASR